MKVLRELFNLESEGLHPTFHNVTEQVKKIVERSAVRNGVCLVYSHHTTCSVMLQEDSHDKTLNGLDYLQQDLCNIMEKFIPTCRSENQYMHPGPKLVKFAGDNGEIGPWTLNTDAHLRSVFFGRSESIVIMDGELDLGEFGRIYFIDWDQVRARTRQVQIQIIGE